MASFDRTYEELKPRVGGLPVFIGTNSFDRTYEELKRIPPRTIASSNLSFDRTYEELKLIFRMTVEEIAAVSIVPMRN